MPSIILRPYLLSALNRFNPRFRLKHELRRSVLLLLVCTLLMLCIFLAFVLILGSLKEDPLFRQVIPRKILELLHYGFFLLLIFSNTVSALGRVYTAENMDLLLTTPVSALRLFIAKFIEIYFETTLMLFVFVFPVGLAYCWSLGLHADFLLSLMSVLVVLAAIPTGLSFVLATIISRVAAHFWKRGGLMMASLILLGVWAVWMLVKLLNQVKLERGATNAMVQFIGLFDNPNPAWLPSRWAVDTLSPFFGVSPDLLGIKLIVLVSTAFAALALGFLFFDIFALRVRSLSGLHLNSSNCAAKHQTDYSRRILEIFFLYLPLEKQFRAIALKDLTSLIRDRAQSLQLIMYLGVALVALVIIEFMSSAFNLSLDAQQAWWSILFSINFLFVGFILTALMTRLVYPSISLEGKAFWILRTAPIALEQMIEAKFWCWLPIITVIALVLLAMGAAAIEASFVLLIYSFYLGACLSLGCTGLAIGIGASFATFQWESPSQIASSFGTLALLLSSLFLVVVTAIPASILYFIFGTLGARYVIGLEKTPCVAACCIVLIFVINAAAASIACKKGAASLEKHCGI